MTTELIMKRLLISLCLLAGISIGDTLAQTANYDVNTRYLTLPSVQIGVTTYYNVVVRLDSFAVISADSAPSAPTGLSVTAVPGQISISFTPGNSGSATPTYAATCTPASGGTGITSISSSSSPVSVSGLTNGTAYTCTVEATSTAGSATSSPSAQVTPTAAAMAPPIYVVLFTHIEDDTPSGALGTETARSNYLLWRSRLIAMAELASRNNMTWVLQPDWKFLLAAQQYEDATVTASTGGNNVLRYLRDSLGVVIDPHSHEAGGYNYTDVAYLLEQLGVGGTTVIGGHVWDPSLPQFAHWDRFRVPVAGEHYPSATWRGDILMGSGTPNHTNDPIVSGVWRPKDPLNFWVDDPAGSIASVGAYKNDITSIGELTSLYQTGQVDASCMLTSTYHIRPTTLSSSTSLAALEQDVLVPLQSLRSKGEVEITNFTNLIATWQTQYAGKACIH